MSSKPRLSTIFSPMWISFSGRLFGGISDGNFGDYSDAITGGSSVGYSDFHSDSNSDGNSVDISACNGLKLNYLYSIHENPACYNSGDVIPNTVKARCGLVFR
jgi:hypothetical protein